MTFSIQAKGLCHAFHENMILDEVDISAPPYGLVQIHGNNGSGKTTLLRVLANLLRPSSGTIRYFDDQSNVQHRLGWMPASEQGLLWNLTGWENLTLFAKMRNTPMNSLQNRIECLRSFNGFEAALQTEYLSCSTAMKRLLLFANAIAHGPDLLILDEPFSGLDPKNRDQLSEVVETYSNNACVLLSTHTQTQLPGTNWHLENGRLQ